jgi:Tfp pilus assembly protein PilF
MNRRTASYRAYDKALRYDPDNAVVLNNYAYYLSEEGMDLEKALEMSVMANELSPTNSTYLDTQAWIYYKLGMFEEARKVQQQAISFDSSSNSVLFLHYGDILYRLGERFMAEVYWKRALENGHDRSEIEERLKLPAK